MKIVQFFDTVLKGLNDKVSSIQDGSTGGQAYFNCNFETGTCPNDLELVLNSNADSEFMWQRNSGCTQTGGTGPCQDHTSTGGGS